jgi:hypothetical protein
LVNRGDAVKGLSGARVIIKILGSSFTPLIFHAKTDDNGIATVICNCRSSNRDAPRF